jgi:invasion protein IalB
LSVGRCIPRHFPAEYWQRALTDDVAKKLRARTDPDRVEFKDGNQRDVAVPVSFDGFTTAFEAWQKE